MTSLPRRIGLCCSLAAAVAAGSCGGSAVAPTPAAEAAAPGPGDFGRIVVLGDSLAVSPSRSVNFPAELQRRIDDGQPGWAVVNAGVNGDTTAGGLRRVPDAITRDTRILLIELGANDGLRGVSVATVEQNLAAIIEYARDRDVDVLLCGMETPPTRGWEYTFDFHRVFPRLAERYDVPLVPFLLAGVALNPDMNGDDSIHPNAAGAQRIAETVWPHLEPLIRANSAGAAR